MSLGFSSIRRQTLFYTMVFFVASLFTSVGISYYYLHRENVTDQYLLQQNTLNFCLQELEDNIFYSKISELSNLSIIRNELYRLYRIVDMSLTTPHHEASSELISPYRLDASALAPSSNPYAVTRDVEQARREESIKQNFSLNQLSALLQGQQAPTPNSNLNNKAGFYSATDIIASANERYDQMLAHLSTLDFAYTPAKSSFISSLNHKQDYIPYSNFSTFGLVNPNRLVLYKHLSQLQSLGFIAFSINTKSSAQDLYIHKGYQELLDNLVNEQRSLRELLYNTPIPDSGYFVILENRDGQVSATNPALSPAARALQEQSRQRSVPLSHNSATSNANPAPTTQQTLTSASAPAPAADGSPPAPEHPPRGSPPRRPDGPAVR